MTHRDLKPANVMAAQRQSANGVQHPAPIDETTKPHNLSPRDASALSALGQLRDGSGRVPAALGTLLDAAHLSAPSWERAVASLKAKGLVRTWLDPVGHYKARRYELTDEGQATLVLLDADLTPKPSDVVPESSPKSSRSPLGSGSKTNGEAKETTTATIEDDVGGVVPKSSAGVVSEVVSVAGLQALLARALDVIEEQARVIAELSGRPRGVPVPSHEPTSSTGEKPCKACGAPTVQREGEHGPFLGCSRFPDCRETSSIGGPPAKGRHRGNSDPDRAWIEAARNSPPVSPENLHEVRAKLSKPAPVGEVVAQVIGATPGRVPRNGGSGG